MHLIWFHRVLIGAAIVFFAGFGVWEIAAFRAAGGAMPLILAVGSFTAAVALGVYLSRLKRILKLP
jgi:hypothetical protein